MGKIQEFVWEYLQWGLGGRNIENLLIKKLLEHSSIPRVSLDVINQTSAIQKRQIFVAIFVRLDMTEIEQSIDPFSISSCAASDVLIK